MTAPEIIDYSALNWVKGEIDETLNQARQALEGYVETPADATQLRFFVTYLHQVRGTLQMLELYGAALLAEEMEYTGQALLQDQVEQREEAFEVLMRALLQMPVYLERLQAGHKDIPLVLLPLLNDLRTTRGQHLLTENVFFAPDLSVHAPEPAPTAAPGPDLRAVARRVRSIYQAALVGWFRDARDRQALSRLLQAVTPLEETALLEPVRQLWWVASGLLEALLDGGLEASPSIRHLLGQIDRQLKAAVDGGEEACAAGQRDELVKNLLYYIGRTRSQGARVQALRAAFQLDSLLPAEQELDAARSDLRGPDASLLQAVARAVNEELLRIKDALDLFVRNPAHPLTELQPMADGLRQTADTLGMLGLGVLRGMIQEQASYIADLLAGRATVSDAGLMKVASTLLYVESSLDGLSRREPEPTAADAPTTGTLPEAEYRQLTQAVIHEAKADITAVKEAIATFAAQPGEAARLSEVPLWLAQVKGGLTILGMESAAALVEGCRRYIQDELVGGGLTLDRDGFDALADAVTAVDYYLEAVAENRADKAHILDLGQHSIARLERQRQRKSTPTPVPAAPKAPTEDLDAEVIEVFLEEADEEGRAIAAELERWVREPDNADALTRIRRAFHTLKGSGRLVGASALGEFAWAIEGLLNRVIAGTVAPSAAIHAVVADARAALPQLLAAFRGEGEPSTDIAALTARAEQLAAAVEPALAPLPVRSAVARIDSPPIVPASPPAPAVAAMPSQPPAEAEGESDEVRQVFLEEAVELLETMGAQLDGLLQAPGEPQWLAELQRALHTLKGGARMAEISPIADLCHGLETLLGRMIDAALPAGHTVQQLLQAAHDRLADMIEAVRRRGALRAAEDLLSQVEEFDLAPSMIDEAPVVAASTVATPMAETLRVRADRIDDLVNAAGELGIQRAHLGQQLAAIRYNLGELGQTIRRLHEQARRIEIASETRGVDNASGEAPAIESFDPLEFERFSEVAQLARGVSESVADLEDLQRLLKEFTLESDSLLQQQERIGGALHDGLLRTRMVPFAGIVSRLRRLVRQTCEELGKQAELVVHNPNAELDRQVLGRILPVLEHMARNAIDHGLETLAERREAGKPETGTVRIALAHEGPEVVIRIDDDGRGLDLAAIRRTALAKGLLGAGAELSEQELAQFILAPGFTTASQVTQISGRGVGMDVVNMEIKQLGGSLHIDSHPGAGTRFTIRLPLTLAVQHVLMVRAHGEPFALPFAGFGGVARVERSRWRELRAAGASFDHGGQHYRCLALNTLLGYPETSADGDASVLLYQLGDHRVALEAEAVLGGHEVVLKSVGSLLASIAGVSAGTVLPDGRVALILDLASLVRADLAHIPVPTPVLEPAADTITALIVDDSLTVRKVTSRLLERHQMQPVTAVDGLDALAKLEEQRPDIVLLDIEMPRMDGFEFCAHLRNDERFRTIPVIMITSRTGEKHRQHALELGANLFLGKPYREQELLDGIRALVGARA